MRLDGNGVKSDSVSSSLLRSFRVRNYKAIRDSGIVRLEPLTVLIGGNGSGKSSFIEALGTLQVILGQGLDAAMVQAGGFEHVWYKGAPHRLRQSGAGRPYQSNPMQFNLRGRSSLGSFAAQLEIGAGPGANELFIRREHYSDSFCNSRAHRDDNGLVIYPGFGRNPKKFGDGESVIDECPSFTGFAAGWQFMSLIPQRMLAPTPQKRTGRPDRLYSDGSNIADYLRGILDLDLERGTQTFHGLIEALRVVLPYARDLQPAITSEIQRTVYLQMTEQSFEVPGWLLSTGTLRILALLAVLRHPKPPPLIVVDEIENGLDPATLHLLVEEIRAAVESGRTQVIITTHSPYLLDLLDLSHIVLVERVEGQPVFTRPADVAALQEWSQRFGPGKLYTTGRLNRGATK